MSKEFKEIFSNGCFTRYIIIDFISERFESFFLDAILPRLSLLVWSQNLLWLISWVDQLIVCPNASRLIGLGARRLQPVPFCLCYLLE